MTTAKFLAFSLTSVYYEVRFSSLRKEARGFGTVEKGLYIGLHPLPDSNFSPCCRVADVGICRLQFPNHTETLLSVCPEKVVRAGICLGREK